MKRIIFIRRGAISGLMDSSRRCHRCGAPLPGIDLGRYLFDGYARIVSPIGPVPLGEMEVPAGEHKLRFKIVGKNPKSKAYSMGLDCLAFEKRNGK